MVHTQDKNNMALVEEIPPPSRPRIHPALHRSILPTFRRQRRDSSTKNNRLQAGKNKSSSQETAGAGRDDYTFWGQTEDATLRAAVAHTSTGNRPRPGVIDTWRKHVLSHKTLSHKRPPSLFIARKHSPPKRPKNIAKRGQPSNPTVL